MKNLAVKYSKGQMKVQQMAFVLVAIVVFFVIVGLFILSVSFSSLRGSAENLRDQEALSAVKRLASSPEFSWTIEDCASCIDFDKVLALKNRASYREFWDFSLLRIERVYPKGSGECTSQNYPDCGQITIEEKSNIPGSKSSFVSLCRYDNQEKFYRCELGRLIVSEEALNG